MAVTDTHDETSPEVSPGTGEKATGNETTKPSRHAGLIGDSLKSDPRIAQAKKLIAEAICDHGQSLTDVRPPQTAAADDHQTLIDRISATRGGPPIWPYLSTGIGRGPYVELTDGSVKLDFIGGIGVHGAGHSSPKILDAAIDAAIEDTVMQGNLQQHPPSIDFAERMISLASQSGAKLDRGLIATSGAMANENALKLAMHHRAPADRVIAFDNAFAGRSLAMAAITDRAKYRSGLPVTVDVDYLPFRDPHHVERSTRWAVDECRRLLDRHPDRYAAFWAEPIAGEGGYYEGGEEFFTRICEVLRQADVPIIFDEVQSFSRTSRPFAFQHYRLDAFADIVTFGKITQACGTLWGEAFHPTAPILSQTFTGSSSAIAAGSAMIDGLLEANCFGEQGQNVRRHQYFAAQLEELAARYPGRVGGPYGVGMMVAFTPDDGSFEAAKAMMDQMYDAGLLGFVCGGGPTRIRFLPPPVITTNEHIDAAIRILDQVLACRP